MKAIVFAGQGCQKRGMGLDAVATNPAAKAVWDSAERRIRSRTGMKLSEVVRDNPPYLHMYENALKPHLTSIADPDPNLPESHPLPHRVHMPAGVIGATYLTQPAVLTAQLALLEEARAAHGPLLDGATVFAGHSLGEFTALTAMGLLPPDVAAELTFRRGAWMEAALTLGSVASRPQWLMYAVNPTRAQLDTTAADGTSRVSGEDVLAYLVELISAKLRHTTSWLEIVNYNVPGEQWVVAGDEVALSILGKCVDPLFRANASLQEKVEGYPSLVSAAARDTQRDIEAGNNDAPNAPAPADFVSASWHAFGRRNIFQRTQLTQDDGKTLPLERLTHLTLEREGRSGLKKKSWFMPLPVDVPFHSSKLRRAMDNFHQDCLDALPSEELIAKVFEKKKWVTNLTGTVFDPASAQFLSEFTDAVRSHNIGEQSHSGKYASTKVTEAFVAAAKGQPQQIPLSSSTPSGTDEASSSSAVTASTSEVGVNPRALLAATMAAQLAHSVQWMDSMSTITDTLKCTTIIEISPTRTLAPMFKKSTSSAAVARMATAAEHAELSGITIVSLPTETASV